MRGKNLKKGFGLWGVLILGVVGFGGTLLRASDISHHSQSDPTSVALAPAPLSSLKTPELQSCGGHLDANMSVDDCAFRNPAFAFVQIQKGDFSPAMLKHYGLQEGDTLQLFSAQNQGGSLLARWRNIRTGSIQEFARYDEGVIEKRAKKVFESFLDDTKSTDQLVPKWQRKFSETEENQNYVRYLYAHSRLKAQNERIALSLAGETKNVAPGQASIVRTSSVGLRAISKRGGETSIQIKIEYLDNKKDKIPADRKKFETEYTKVLNQKLQGFSNLDDLSAIELQELAASNLGTLRANARIQIEAIQQTANSLAIESK